MAKKKDKGLDPETDKPGQNHHENTLRNHEAEDLDEGIDMDFLYRLLSEEVADGEEDDEDWDDEFDDEDFEDNDSKATTSLGSSHACIIGLSRLPSPLCPGFWLRVEGGGLRETKKAEHPKASDLIILLTTCAKLTTPRPTNNVWHGHCHAK